jgi:hypothetical protein
MNKRLIRTTDDVWDKLSIEEKDKYKDSIIFIQNTSNNTTGIIEVNGIKYGE